MIETYTSSTITTYKCAKKCPVLSQESTVSGQQVCKQCYSNTAMPVYDFSTKSCIAESVDCPEGTVMTTLAKLADSDSKITSTVTVDPSTIKVCAMCDKRCKCCESDSPKMCLTCADDFVTTTKDVTVDGTTKSITMCTKECGPGMYPDAAKVCTNSCLENCAKCSDGDTCLRCKKDFYLNDSGATHTCVAETNCPAGTYANKLTGKCETCDSTCTT